MSSKKLTSRQDREDIRDLYMKGVFLSSSMSWVNKRGERRTQYFEQYLEGKEPGYFRKGAHFIYDVFFVGAELVWEACLVYVWFFALELLRIILIIAFNGLFLYGLFHLMF